jgi:hypothetical protein
VRFETIPAGEARQFDGPWFGVRVLSAGEGAAVAADRIALPLSVLPSYRAEIGTLTCTGPIVLALADDEDEDVNAASATPQPQVGRPPDTRIASYAGGYSFPNHLVTSSWEFPAVTPPPGARSGMIYTRAIGGPGPAVSVRPYTRDAGGRVYPSVSAFNAWTQTANTEAMLLGLGIDTGTTGSFGAAFAVGPAMALNGPAPEQAGVQLGGLPADVPVGTTWEWRVRWSP